MMERFLSIILILLISASSYAANQDDRRIEEEKRKSLKSTEAQYYTPQRASLGKQKDVRRQYFDQLLSQPTVRLEDAAYVMTVLLGKIDERATYQEQIDYLLENGMIPPGKEDGLMKNQAVNRGYFAYMLFKALGLKGGLTIRVLGPSPRYAHKELVYEGIMLSGSSAEIMTGRELVYSFVQAADYISRYK